jgi:hypothetical protein
VQSARQRNLISLVLSLVKEVTQFRKLDIDVIAFLLLNLIGNRLKMLPPSSLSTDRLTDSFDLYSVANPESNGLQVGGSS